PVRPRILSSIPPAPPRWPRPALAFLPAHGLASLVGRRGKRETGLTHSTPTAAAARCAAATDPPAACLAGRLGAQAGAVQRHNRLRRRRGRRPGPNDAPAWRPGAAPRGSFATPAT